MRRGARWALRAAGVAALGLVVLVGIGVLYQQTMWRLDAARVKPRGRMVEMGGVGERLRVHLDCRGYGGPVVVLESRIGESSLGWRAVQRELERGGRVCTYDRPGYGYSDRTARIRTARGSAELLHALLAKAGEAGPFVVVGEEYGGLIAQLYAVLYPEETAGVVLVEAEHARMLERMPGWWRREREERGAWFYVSQSWMALGVQRLAGRCEDGPEELRVERRRTECDFEAGLAKRAEEDQLEKSEREARALLEPVRPVLGLKPLVVMSRDGSREPGEVEHEWGEMQRELAGFSMRGERRVVAGAGPGLVKEHGAEVAAAVAGVRAKLRQSVD